LEYHRALNDAIWSIGSSKRLKYNTPSEHAEHMINMQLQFKNQETD